MKFKLIKIKDTGMRVTLADGEKDSMISSGLLLQRERPDLQLEVINMDGVCVWPMSA